MPRRRGHTTSIVRGVEKVLFMRYNAEDSTN
jgi:hypothetical protein